MRRTKLVALSTSGVLALTLAACSSGGPGGGNSGGAGASNGAGADNTKAAEQGQDAKATGPAAPVSGAKTGGTLYLTESSAPPTMDPSGIYYVDSNGIGTGLMYRTLTQYKVENGKPVLVPDLATDLGQQSADGKTWKFKIKPGIKYDDGSPVKIEDFVYAVKRSFARESVAANGTTYQDEFLVGGDKYKGPFKDPKGDFPGVTTEGSDTLVFHLTKKMPSFNFFTTFPEFSPIPKSRDTNPNNYQLKPATTGPYKVDSYTKGQKLVLSKNTNWDPKSDPARHQYPDKIQVEFNKDPRQRQTQILANSGQGASMLDFSPGIDSSLVGQVTGAKKSQFIQGASPCTYFIQMDSRKIPMNIRKIIGMAWPYDQMRKAAGVASINIQPATTYGAPSLQGFKKYPPVNGATGQGKGDPAKAKAELQKAGKLGFELSWYYRNDTPQRVASNNAEVQALTAAGFKVKPIGVSGEEYTTKKADPNAPVNMNQGPAGWCYDWPTGDSVYPPLFNGLGIPQGTTVGQFKDPAITKEMNQIQQMDPKAAGPKWAELDKKLMTDYLPSLPDYYPLQQATFGTKVKNVVLNPAMNMPVLSGIYVTS
ncbi:ABC transporter substrate-binding protein [Flexivirga meconopsidis]|uniref:ABC transporter substrate-binding protein n=1 Tax=Flexivirga meconopsidis TaxID=2977121 RepID=UPI00223FCC19|nr:ABC transporter substrate-binding protein [Flexivirga meconopsidis]